MIDDFPVPLSPVSTTDRGWREVGVQKLIEIRPGTPRNDATLSSATRNSGPPTILDWLRGFYVYGNRRDEILFPNVSSSGSSSTSSIASFSGATATEAPSQLSTAAALLFRRHLIGLQTIPSTQPLQVLIGTPCSTRVNHLHWDL
jgi:hypothetical protein